MTSTPVKDVGSVFTNPGAAQAGKTAGSTGDFQKIWSNQMNRNTMGSYVPNGSAQSAAAQTNAKTAKEPEAGAKAGTTVQQKEQAARSGDESTVESSGEMNAAKEATEAKDEFSAVQDTSTQQTEELMPEELEQAMEVLGTAVFNLMQQIADAFGISMEDLQMTMDELGMEQMDLLNADAFGSLLLKLGGAEDSYALLMDETLYGNYQALMGQLDSTMKESAAALETEPGQLEELIRKISVSEVSSEENTDSVEVSNQEEEQMTNADSGVSLNVAAEAMAGKQDISEEQTEGQSGQTREDGRHSAEKTEVESHEQIFGQSFRTEEFQPQVQQAESILQNSGWSADTRNIMNQIMDYMKLQLSVDTTSLEMQLHPASLGTLRVQIDSSAGVLTAHFITQNETVKAALESQMVQLQESFEEQGVKVQAIEVTVQTHEFEQNLEQGRDRNQQTPEKRNRTRRIQLNDALAMENMEEEDALAADMMAANGNTVDYTV